MKSKSPIIAGFILLFIPYVAHSADFLTQPPPQSMDKSYSERGKTSEWIEQMRQISKTFGATFISMDQGSREKALKSAQDFGAAYQKASEMVPEWEDLFDLKASENFIASIKSQNAEKNKTILRQRGKNLLSMPPET